MKIVVLGCLSRVGLMIFVFLGRLSWLYIGVL